MIFIDLKVIIFSKAKWVNSNIVWKDFIKESFAFNRFLKSLTGVSFTARLL